MMLLSSFMLMMLLLCNPFTKLLPLMNYLCLYLSLLHAPGVSLDIPNLKSLQLHSP